MLFSLTSFLFSFLVSPFFIPPPPPFFLVALWTAQGTCWCHLSVNGGAEWLSWEKVQGALPARCRGYSWNCKPPLIPSLSLTPQLLISIRLFFFFYFLSPRPRIFLRTLTMFLKNRLIPPLLPSCDSIRAPSRQLCKAWIIVPRLPLVRSLLMGPQKA